MLMTTESGEQTDHRQILLSNRATVVRVVHTVARRFALRHDEEQDLLSHVYVRLLDQGGRVLRQFAGRSRLAAY